MQVKNCKDDFIQSLALSLVQPRLKSGKLWYKRKNKADIHKNNIYYEHKHH